MAKSAAFPQPLNSSPPSSISDVPVISIAPSPASTMTVVPPVPAGVSAPKTITSITWVSSGNAKWIGFRIVLSNLDHHTFFISNTYCSFYSSPHPLFPARAQSNEVWGLEIDFPSSISTSDALSSPFISMEFNPAHPTARVAARIASYAWPMAHRDPSPMRFEEHEVHCVAVTLRCEAGNVHFVAWNARKAEEKHEVMLGANGCWDRMEI